MAAPLSPAEEALREAAREYHRSPVKGKISITPTKPLLNQRDLSLAYSPGVAYPCLDIAADPATASEYTARGNLVGVVTNGTAVLGLGDIGPLAAKPVMEGKGCLFKKFAGIDVFDIELAERDPDKLVDIIAALEPTLGGINLEDIKAPECFYIEKKLRERMNIPVFHDDQHGTAIISAAALINGLELVGKKIEDVKIAVSGAGAAAIACLDVMVGLGAKPANIHACDSKGLIYMGRAGGFDESKARYAQKDTGARTLADVVKDADVFLGCSAPGVMTAEMVKTMASQPIILALANPEPEIRPELAKAVRPDCIIATGRSDYPNQVNNVLCFPYIFRGALDCGASKITEEMKLACVREIAELTKADISEEVATAYAGQELAFGPDYIIPKPFDSRLILRIAPAVAKAAAASGVATRPIEDMDAYRQHLTRFVYQTGMFMRPVFSAAKIATAKRVAYAEGEDERVLRAAQWAVDEGLAKPILVGRPAVIDARIKKAGLHIRAGVDFEIVNPEDDPRFRTYWESFHKIMGRRGVTPEAAKTMVRRSNTTIAALMMHLGDADAMICGLVGRFDVHLEHIRNLIGLKRGAPGFATLNALTLDKRTVFITDTNVNEDPSAELLASIAVMAAEEVRRFGLPPKVAFLSHSNYGTSSRSSARKMRLARDLFAQMAPDIECDGEMHGDAALSEEIRRTALPETTLSGEANLLVCPNLDSAHILYNVLKMTGANGITVGPVLLGAASSAHVLTPSSTVRRIINMTALAVAKVTVDK
ncbi:NADP-dependent malic enzyme [Variovorax sp. NFACC27]|uniref:NADP-dependent malic enzyme n=1 Tax=Variovorax gossypii TaxID=1679495 RepID=A0A3S0JUT0_9BURK|nr:MULTISPECIES: NADP-dependent malic enzyme [Variovorax]MDP9603894.1 malate dehydrogenase (oxaloacetate-decarboxylating)(NADP+) [Variovorax paradoxus]SEF26550.1 malate dehydrogenase (oxaloacetate-decarboxylating)(NADP+) [Variovorax sp. NFACC28]SEG58632.1 malate dehydrogenase (oxaloacetate-decarboxylating)(NADP+) [Variovorax sp. NFACC29]SFC57491.1 malate dehydrogenase (oxaloacetate-decarboxylating)(NADP+) [Variovorax sp. NFACC26]SFG65909.1 malate dehydrogenase (oxaloacetate-decarboxylating)(NA